MAGSVYKEYYLLSVVWGFLFFGSLQCEGIGYQKPINCAYLECPAYDVVHTESQFEIRVYKDAKWVAFPVSRSRFFRDASTKGFLELFSYINGNNQDGRNMSITAPVLVDIGTSIGRSPYIVYYYLPQKFQENPPLPMSAKDQLVNLPPRKFAAVRRFGGFADDRSIQREASALRRYLRGTLWQSAYKFGLYSQAGYNAPFERDNRVNEILIWFD